MFDLLVDIYELAESTVNAEPQETAALLHADVPAQFLRMSGHSRYLAAGLGVVLDARLAVEHRGGITEKTEVRNVRTREGSAVAAQPARYRVLFVNPGRRGQHLELDLEALR
ncbi:MAG: hypothetical protein M1325_04405 [Actinobacteria bacterium]|nr:hypothetical protein [Actinomycetota bacterium]